MTSSLLGRYLYLNQNIYKVVQSTLGLDEYISFYNEQNNLYLRHRYGNIIESEYSESELFKYDSSFKPVNEEHQFIFYCSNKNLQRHTLSEKNLKFFIDVDDAKLCNNRFELYSDSMKPNMIESIILQKINQLNNKIDELSTFYHWHHPIYTIPHGCGDIREFQLDGLELLKFFDTVCQKYDLKYWIDYGTLLGAIRHKGFIPWDDDLDVCMLYDDFIKFHVIINHEVQNTYFSYSQNFHPYIYKILSSKGKKRNAWLDIFPFYYLLDDIDINVYKTDFISARKQRSELINNNSDIETIRKFAHDFNKSHQSLQPTPRIFNGFEAAVAPYCYVLNYDDIFPLIKLDFEDASFFAPCHYHHLLTQEYGNYWDYPATMKTHLKW